MEKTIKEFIGDKAVYESMGQMIFAVDKDGGHQMFLDLRGWGHIQNMFKLPGGQIDEQAAMKYQDQLGQWVVDAINEKLKREKSTIATKQSKKQIICNEFIEAWKPVFEAYPELHTIPVYAWGRYYKYECSGDPFETCCDEDGISQFESMLPYQENIQWDLIKQIDDEHNIEGGKLWMGEWGGYAPSRKECVNAFDHFDERGGKCLLISRTEDGFEVKDVECDSPE